MNLQETLARIVPVDSAWNERADLRQSQLTKPPGSLGRLEEVANRLCAIQETLQPQTRPRRIVIFAADHGVANEGVSAYPPSVTAQMVANFRRGGAAINALARVANADLHVVDIGVAGEEIEVEESEVDASSTSTRYYRCRVGPGTRSFTQGAAMTQPEVCEALQVGIGIAEKAARDGIKLLAIGEMGIGNTTAASALTAALTGLEPIHVTGRGTGADDATWRRKVHAVAMALAVNGLEWPHSGMDDPERVVDVMRRLGGLEIAGMCGLCLGAAKSRIAVVVDGFIATSAAALAVKLCPPVTDYLFASHQSTEPGHQALLDIIGQKPLLDLGMRLGEGSGAALALPLLDAAVATFTQMATFAAAGVDGANT